MKNKCFNIVFFLILNSMINAADDKEAWHSRRLLTTPVTFEATFRSKRSKLEPSTNWNSKSAYAKTTGVYSDAINPEDGKAGIIHSFNIDKLFGQKPKNQDGSSYVYPNIDCHTRKKIKATLLSQYRYHILRQELENNSKAKDSASHLESLCEACQTRCINCATGGLVLPALSTKKTSVVSIIKPSDDEMASFRMSLLAVTKNLRVAPAE